MQMNVGYRKLFGNLCKSR